MELRMGFVAKCSGQFVVACLVLLSLTATQTVYAGGSATPPDWVAGIQPGTWTAISLNRMADVDPENDPQVNPNYPGGAPWRGNSGQSCVLDCWNGGVLASGYGSHGALLTYGGGHFGYGGSEVYAFDLGTRRWTRVTDPYPTPNMNYNYNNGKFPDGSPVPAHTYDYVDYHPGTNSFVLLRAHTNVATASIGLPIAYMLDLDTGQWRNSQRAGDGLALFSGGFSCYDRNRDVFWAMGPYAQSRFAQFNPNGRNSDGTYGRWTNYPKDNIDIDGMAECDPNHDVMIYTQFRGNTQMWARDLSNPNATRVAVTQTGDIPPRSGRHAWEWSEKRQSFIYNLHGSADVYEFKLDANDFTRGTWRKLTSSSNSVTPQSMQTANGIYSRFRIARYGDEEVAVLINRRDGQVYAWRMVGSTGSAPVVSVSLSANPRNVANGGSTTLNWSSSNASSCSASGAWGGSKSTSGQQTLSNLTQSATYELTCTGSSGSTGHAAVQITVDAPVSSNSAPTISGSPDTQIAHGEFFGFTPTASDNDGDALTFSISGRPAWASFNPSTGALTGTPGVEHIDSSSQIRITVSDGTASAALPEFTLTVIDGGSYGGMLSWLPPTTNTDGSSLSDLDGYRIYYGAQAGNYSETVDIDNAGQTNHVFGGLSAGTYYFSVSALDDDGNESPLSEEIAVYLGADAEPGSGSGSGGSTPPPVVDNGSGGSNGSGPGSTDSGSTDSGSTDSGSANDAPIVAEGEADETLPVAAASGPFELLLLFGALLMGVLRRRAIRRPATRHLAVTLLGCSFMAGSLPAGAEDFATRCSKPGVLKCIGFDSDDDIRHNVNLFPAAGGQWRGDIDTSVRASGNGSLRFVIPSGSGPNASGYYSTTMGQKFGPGDTFYVQFRQRFSPEMLNTRFSHRLGHHDVLEAGHLSHGRQHLREHRADDRQYSEPRLSADVQSLRSAAARYEFTGRRLWVAAGRL